MQTFRFCPHCGARCHPRVIEGKTLATCPACDQVFYENPKVAACCLVHDRKGKVLLVRRAIEPSYGLWTFPGGYVDRGETTTAAALRECREEASTIPELEKLVGVYSYPGKPVVVVVYAAVRVDHQAAAGPECLEVGWFKTSQLPWEQLAFESVREALEDWLREG